MVVVRGQEEMDYVAFSNVDMCENTIPFMERYLLTHPPLTKHPFKHPLQIFGLYRSKENSTYPLIGQADVCYQPWCHVGGLKCSHRTTDTQLHQEQGIFVFQGFFTQKTTKMCQKWRKTT